ncbi:MAG: autotransporter domain-containing protein, partial [Planctomycetes bacterium]|nr:autotransporter domain-containing protein [Planctomycetota bacterium]
IAGVNNLIKDTAGTFRLGGHLTLAGRLDVRDGRLAVEVGNDPSPAGMPGTGTATITADSATFSNRSVLDIDAYHGDGATERNQQVIIRTVSEDIAAVPNYTIAGQQPQNVDFLSLQLRIDDSNRKELYVDSWLRWYDPRPNEAHGTFTLTGDGSFTLGAALNDEAPEAATDWDGKSLTKKGSGRLILRGLSGYTGDTTIEAGTLTLTNNLSTGANNAGRRVMNSGLLQFDFGLAASDVYNLDITGTGDLIKTANGRLALSGNNTYSGRTLIDDGIIAITNYNALGVNSAATSVAMNSGATLELAMATDGNFNKAIGGAGGVRMSGTGTATLTAANSYSGGTVVEDGGGLVAANNRALGSGGIRLENGSSLDLDFNGVFANDMLRGTAGVGLADVDGTLNTRGNIQFSGDHTDYDGLVNVLSDRLTLGTVSRTAFSSGADYDVHNGATLAGNGTIGRQDITEPGLRVRTGGTVSPGNSIGRIRVNGDVVMESGSFYEVEVDWSNSNMSDRITASGSADLQDGADGRPTVVYFGGIGGAAATTGNRWLILSASVLNGTFADVVTRSRYITPSLEYDAANAYLVLRRNGVGFVEDGMTVNQRSVGNALETLNPASDLYAQVTALGGTDDIGYAFDLLSGEMHASLVGALGNYNRSIASALRRRIIENPDCGYPLWASVDGYYALTESSKPANTARARYTSYGVSVGGEMRPGNRAILGAAFRYGDGRLKLDGRHSRADIDSFSFSLYGGWDAWQTTDATVKLMAGAGYGMHRTDSKRSITAPLAPQTLNDKYTNHSYQLFAEALYQYRMSERWTLEPYAALEWDMLRTGSIGESGGSAALTADRDSHHTVMSTLGARVEFRPAQKMTVGVDAGWQHIYGKRNPASHFRYAAGSDEFRIQGAPYARNIARASVYATYAIRECFTIQVGYDGVFGNRYASHGGEIKMQLGF